MSDWKRYMAENDAYAASIESRKHRVYEVNPYLLVFEDEDDSDTYHLYFDAHQKGASVWMHLIVGEERALLIDTGFGIGNLRGLVELLTDKPYDVVNTHFHGDHSAGDGQFEAVFCHKYDVPYLRAALEAPAGKRMLLPEGYYREQDIVPIRPVSILEMEDGHQFRLGEGHTVEVIHMPGHAAGGCMLLDHKSGMLFSGDAVLATPTLILDRFPSDYYPEYLTVRAFKDALAAAGPRLKEVRKIHPGHGPLGISSAYLEDMERCCGEIMTAPEHHELYDYVSDPTQNQIMCVGRAMVVYSDSRIGL